jgi:hypothetical protein
MSHFVRAAAHPGFLLIASSLLLLICPFLTSEAVTASQPESVATTVREFTPDLLPISEDLGDAVVDLYGNDVTDAVAEYTLDAAGSLYEVHSPRTELVRLASPKT